MSISPFDTLTCYLFFQDIVITPNQVGLPLCKWCRRPVNGLLHKHERRCWWCETCKDFVTTDVSRHKCSPPGPDTVACPICGRLINNKNYLLHLKNRHPDLDTTHYRRRTETAKERDRRLAKEGKVFELTGTDNI